MNRIAIHNLIRKRSLETVVHGQFEKCFQNAKDKQIFIGKILNVALCRKSIIHHLKSGRWSWLWALHEQL